MWEYDLKIGWVWIHPGDYTVDLEERLPDHHGGRRRDLYSAMRCSFRETEIKNAVTA